MRPKQSVRRISRCGSVDQPGAVKSNIVVHVPYEDCTVLFILRSCGTLFEYDYFLAFKSDTVGFIWFFLSIFR